MNRKRGVLLATILVTVTGIAPLSSFAQECDGDYYAGIGANQHYTGDKRQRSDAYLLKHRTSQQLPQRAGDAPRNRSPS